MRNCFLFTLLFFLTACKDPYEQMIEWIDHFDSGTPIEQVRREQPGFVFIDWGHPDSSSVWIRYKIGTRERSKNPEAKDEFIFVYHELFIGRDSQQHFDK